MNAVKKKLSAIVTASVLFVALMLPVLSAEHMPVAKYTGERRTDGDVIYEFETSADSYILEMESTRRATLAELTKKGYSGADIPHAIRYPLELTVKCVSENGDIGYAANVPVTADRLEASLIDDIMPSFVGTDGDISDALLNGFSFSLSVCYTHFDGTRRYEIEEYGESAETGGFFAPEMFYIGYVLPKDASNGVGNISFGYAPLTSPVKLSAPSKSGCTFTGWTDEAGEYVGTVNAGTKKLILKSNWDDRSYSVKYVLTTASGYNFMRVDNTANPVLYYPSEGAALVSPVVPKGWRFLGWTDRDGVQVTEIPKGTIGDVVVYAYWLSEDDYIDKLISDAHWCDVNDDGKITVSDARDVLRAAVGIEALPSKMIKRVDFAGQGRADVSQARFVLRVAVGIDTVRDILEYYGYEFE